MKIPDEGFQAFLRKREILMAFMPDDGIGFNVSCHITCLERLRDLQRDLSGLQVYAVDFDRLAGGFDHPFADQQLKVIRSASKYPEFEDSIRTNDRGGGTDS